MHPSPLAISLRKDLGLTERVFDLDRVVTEMGLRVCYGPIAGGAEGLSVVFGGEVTILVNSESRNSGRQRFTLAHELGHCLLEHPRACRPAEVLGQSIEPEEREANEFAVNLLMPARLFRADSAKAAPRMGEFTRLAQLYSVSRTAAALRFLKFTEDPCVLVGINSDRNWVAKSSSAEGFWIRNQLPSHYSSSDLKHEGAQVTADTWIENYRGDRRRLILEEVASAGPSSWLILLSELPSVEDDDDPTDKESGEELERRRKSFRSYG